MNLKHPVFAAALVAAVGIAPAAFAADAPAAGKPHMAPMKFDGLDKNKDGNITLDELQAAVAGTPRASRAAQMFKRMDKNGDGKVTKAEFEAWKAMRKARMQNRKAGDNK